MLDSFILKKILPKMMASKVNRPIYIIFGICSILLVHRVLLYLFPLTSITNRMFNVHYSLNDNNNRMETANVIFGDVFEDERKQFVSQLSDSNRTGRLVDLASLTPETGGRPLRSGEFH